MTRSLLVVLTLLFCAAAHGVSFHPCAKPGGGVMYSNVPCDCLQLSGQNRTYYSKCAYTGMPTAAQQERAKRKQDQVASRSYASVEERREQNEKRRLEDQKRQIESKKQRVFDEIASSFKNPGSQTYGSLLGTQLSLAQKRLELVTINNELEAKDKELDKYRSPEEVVLLQAERARARQNRKEAAERVAEKQRLDSQEQRSREMKDKIDGIADKLRVR